MNDNPTLRTLAQGQWAVVTKLTAKGELGRRLRDMGLAPGARLQMMCRAPLKDPVEIKLRGYNLTLRNNEADHVFVQPEEQA
ncbi:FeoA family protein [Desulfarculus baarsii DSM 2075]|uniref:FeoA family protein n=1 Tax=Desulfarculus baarsii (strain ATCC 33931 / DSM 2075 / LMG 7858 / VKM B-1802 / 2st14) TaxID=644282 RepID=E1QEM9_DESB2|nr:FeoA family protein [Desulfarculus baarsii]ADK84015.1 FeoA family protein [Desulfarculus baarsii DSM 2075]